MGDYAGEEVSLRQYTELDEDKVHRAASHTGDFDNPLWR